MSGPRLGLRANLPQFILYSVLTLWIGWFLGMERVVVPILATDVFSVSSIILLLSFIATFGFSKAILNLIAGRWSDRFGRKRVLISGWLVGLPVPLILLYAPAWSWVVMANVLMGFSQALTWTMTQTSGVDLLGQADSGLSHGVNEFSGYAGQATGGVITGFLAGSFGLRPYPFYFGLFTVILGLAFSAIWVKESRHHAAFEATTMGSSLGKKDSGGLLKSFASATWGSRTLLACNQAGLIEKFTDTLVWGIYPLFLADRGFGIVTIGLIVGLYQLVWGISQLFTGVLSDRIGRKMLIVSGMWLMCIGIGMATYDGSSGFLFASAAVTGLGMAFVYPTLLAAVTDEAHPSERGTKLGGYRFWRDSGYGYGALFIGLVANSLGILSAFYFSMILLFASGIVVLVFMRSFIPLKIA